MDLTKFAKKMTGEAGILSLMEDLGKTKDNRGKDLVMMGGGNPGRIPEFQELMRQELLQICHDRERFRALIGSYGPPDGEVAFKEGLVALLRKEQGWQIGPENICLTNGSQTGFFMLFNLFGGEMADGSFKKICLPMAPEYIGYADLGLAEDLFMTAKPSIELLEEPFFKYHIDFDALQLDESIGAICVSRPTNPTGNVITDDELKQLEYLAQLNNIPLIVDSAYGLPFPSIIYTEATPIWNENIVAGLSLSKLGLPAVRTGIMVARKEIISALTGINAIMSLSPNSFGALLAEKLVASSRIIDISRDLIQPYYRRKMGMAVKTVKELFADLPVRIHIPEGAMFLWLWFEGLPITSLELYRKLKEEGVLVVSGHYFFPGLKNEWRHRDECLRVTYSQDDEAVLRGLEIMAGVVKKAYGA